MQVALKQQSRFTQVASSSAAKENATFTVAFSFLG
jgi:hypothetical protein